MPQSLQTCPICATHSCPLQSWSKIPWKGCRIWYFVSPDLLLFWLNSNWFSFFLSPANCSFHGHHNMDVVNPIVNFPPSSYLVYQHMKCVNSIPHPSQKTTFGFPDIILSNFLLLNWLCRLLHIYFNCSNASVQSLEWTTCDDLQCHDCKMHSINWWLPMDTSSLAPSTELLTHSNCLLTISS